MEKIWFLSLNSKLLQAQSLEKGQGGNLVQTMAGSEFGDWTVPNLGSAVLAFGERTRQNPGLAGLEFRESPVSFS